MNRCGYDYCEGCGREVPASALVETEDGQFFCQTCYVTRMEMAVTCNGD